MTFADNWTGSGAIEGEGDAEHISLDAGQYMESSKIIYTGTRSVTLYKNKYGSGSEAVVLKYRHGATSAAATGAEWNLYSEPFESLGYTQVRVEYPA